MSKPREIWWSYAKGMIRQYPQLHEEYKTLHQQSMTMDYGAMPRGGGASRTTEEIAVRALPREKQAEYEAVRRAIEKTKRRPNGKDRMKIIYAYYWREGKTMEGAALTIPCSERTAKRWNGEFVCLVWDEFCKLALLGQKDVVK